jgi:ankyrin repeat protein
LPRLIPDESRLSQLLIKSGAEANVRDLITGFTPLHHAALRDNAALAQILIKAGANVNAVTTENDTPLLVARFEKANKG